MATQEDEGGFELMIKTIRLLEGAEIFAGAVFATAFWMAVWMICAIISYDSSKGEIGGCPTAQFERNTYIRAVPECAKVMNMLVNKEQQ